MGADFSSTCGFCSNFAGFDSPFISCLGACESDNKLIQSIQSGIFSYSGAKFGFVHVALAVGSAMIDWNDSSLVVPRKLKSKNAVMAVDLAEFESGDEQLYNICQVIADYNVNHQYSIFQDNSEHFVRAVCDKINVRLDWILQGQIGTVISNAYSEGFKAKYQIPEQVRPHVKDQKEIVFSSHKQLDDFVEKVRPLRYYSTVSGKHDVRYFSIEVNSL